MSVFQAWLGAQAAGPAQPPGTGALRRLVVALQRAARLDVPLLIVGDPGSGRCMAARLVHELSRHRGQAFIVLDSDWLPPQAGMAQLLDCIRLSLGGLVDAGTIYLRAVERLGLNTQQALAELLPRTSAWPQRAAGPRWIASSAVPLPPLVAQGAFLPGLCMRLSSHSVTMPGLHDYLATATKGCEAVGAASMQPFQQAKDEAVRGFEHQYLLQLMQLAQGNVSRAARIAGKERRALGKLLKKHGVAGGRTSG